MFYVDYKVIAFVNICLLSGFAMGYSGGSGTQSDPYQIANAADLLTLNQDANDYNKCFILTADIDLDPNIPGNKIFKRAVIANNSYSHSIFDGNQFTGTFDGAGHKISNVVIDNTSGGASFDYLGFFGYIGTTAQVKNLKLENMYIKSAGWANCVGGIAAANSGSITNCSVNGLIQCGDYSGNVGGLAGNNDYGTINRCYAAVDINCDSYVSAAGFVASNRGNINNCYSTGKISCGSYSDVAGFVTVNYNLISNCYSTGIITFGLYPSELGAFAARNEGGTISDCFFLDTSGPDNDLGEPLPDAEMKQRSSFTGWDFVGEFVNGTSEIWMINEGISYPTLNSNFASSNSIGFGNFNGKKNVKITLYNCTGQDVTLSLTGDGYGVVDYCDCNYLSLINLYDTTEKSVLTISTKSKTPLLIGSVISAGPLKKITAKNINLSGNLTIGPASSYKSAVSITFNEGNNLNINSQMLISSITAAEWRGSLVAPAVGKITIKGNTKQNKWGYMGIDINTAAIGIVRAADQISGNWNCQIIGSISAWSTDNFNLTVSYTPDPKIPALSKLTIKGYCSNTSIISSGNIGTITLGSCYDSVFFAGVDESSLTDLNGDEVLDLPSADAAVFSKNTTLKKFVIKGQKEINPPYFVNSFVNSNIASVNIMSIFLLYPEIDNNTVPFGITADYIKLLKAKDDEQTVILKELHSQADLQGEPPEDLKIRLF